MGVLWMKFICISASNTISQGNSSASVKTCNMIQDIIQNDIQPGTEVEVLPLRDYDIKPCVLCGACNENARCVYDAAFNNLLDKLETADAVFFVVPHYSPIPAKLIMIFEKINEIVYAGWLNNPEFSSPLRNKPVGIVGHGGMVEDENSLRYYREHLVAPVANTLKSLGFRVIGVNDDSPDGTAFGLKDKGCLKKSSHSIFPDIVQDWTMIEARIEPLIRNVMREIEQEHISHVS
jgi:multimeric flavodoxin WrbA